MNEKINEFIKKNKIREFIRNFHQIIKFMGYAFPTPGKIAFLIRHKKFVDNFSE